LEVFWLRGQRQRSQQGFFNPGEAVRGSHNSRRRKEEGPARSDASSSLLLLHPFGCKGLCPNWVRRWLACSHTLGSLLRKSIRLPVEPPRATAASLTRAPTACNTSRTTPTAGQKRGSLRPRCSRLSLLRALA